ncbi:hypothetical protein [Desulfovibrio intestinalis]|uniref:Putative porin n=1 Tax=Desulfovibrio intestinalis TaxID=58621 RepID=A0A7W8FG71_9BACT|nr:hypothetical protein [Desulfovibrio intestinalis]MBB5143646.1 putative porin [Desulfovibrio intestinalis]
MNGSESPGPLSANVEGAMLQGEDTNASTVMNPKTRNRLSARDKRAKREAVAADYRAGHPKLAIMLRQHLSKPQLSEILAHLFMAGELSPVAPSYELVTASTPIKALSQFADGSVEYVRVEQDGHGTKLTSYLPGVENEHC